MPIYNYCTNQMYVLMGKADAVCVDGESLWERLHIVNSARPQGLMRVRA